LTTVVWVGLDQGTAPTPTASPTLKGKRKPPASFKLTGATAALPIWIRFMNEALAGDPPQSFPLSPELVTLRIDRHTGLKATDDCPDAQTRMEKFERGHEPHSTSCERTYPAPRPVSIAP
jgi:penicillin-binding protein 1A